MISPPTGWECFGVRAPVGIPEGVFLPLGVFRPDGVLYPLDSWLSWVGVRVPSLWRVKVPGEMSPCGVFDWGDRIVGDSTLSFAPAGEGSREPAREFDLEGFLDGIRDPGRVDGLSVAWVRTSRFTELDRPRRSVGRSVCGVDCADEVCFRWKDAIACLRPSDCGSAIRSRGATFPRAKNSLANDLIVLFMHANNEFGNQNDFVTWLGSLLIKWINESTEIEWFWC